MVSVKKIKEFARHIGLDDLRITTARPFNTAYNRIKKQLKEDIFLPGERWRNYDLAKFCDAHSQLNHARTIICSCLSYLTTGKEDLSEPRNPHGLIARYTWGNHYLELKKRLRKLGSFMKKEFNASCRVFSNGPIAEKPAAQRSGIGYYGKHSIIINPTFGSLIVLGEIVTDIEIEPDQPLTVNCGSCTRCIDACPTKAIISPYVIDRKKCIQALTNHPDIIPEEIFEVWENRLYGCSKCQDVCPVNKKVKPFDKKRTEIGYVGPSLPLLQILNMNKTSYLAKYANNQITRPWINFNAIQRNALITLGHIKDLSTKSTLLRFARSKDRILAHAAQWALKRF